MLDEAFALTSRNGERAHEAELHRLQGELLLAGGTADDAMAEYCFPEALAVARRQEARSSELRAATSLVRFYANRGRCDDALHVLASQSMAVSPRVSAPRTSRRRKPSWTNWRPCWTRQETNAVGQFKNRA